MTVSRIWAETECQQEVTPRSRPGRFGLRTFASTRHPLGPAALQPAHPSRLWTSTSPTMDGGQHLVHILRDYYFLVCCRRRCLAPSQLEGPVAVAVLDVQNLSEGRTPSLPPAPGTPPLHLELEAPGLRHFSFSELFNLLHPPLSLCIHNLRTPHEDRDHCRPSQSPQSVSRKSHRTGTCHHCKWNR